MTKTIIAITALVAAMLAGCNQQCQCPIHEIEPGIYLITDYE